MDYKSVYLVFEKLSGTGGGVGSLFLRMIDWCQTRGIKCQLLIRIIDENLKGRYESLGANVVVIQQKNFPKYVSNYLNTCEAGVVFTVDFHMFGCVKNYLLSQHKILYYVVYTYGLFNGTATGLNRLITKIKNFIFRRQYVYSYMVSGNILFMDTNCLNTTLDYYGFSYSTFPNSILHLPIKVNELNESDIKFRAKSKDSRFEILSISRAVFPFKGYLLGLLDDCMELFGKDSNICLTIISYGDRYKEIVRRAQCLNQQYGDRIKLINGISNDELPYFYRSASLYIGMGTTVLEAANYGVPVLLAKAYDNRFLTSGYFSEHPDSILAEGDVRHGINDVLGIKAMEFSEYSLLEKESNEALRKNYDISIFMNHIIRCKPKKGVGVIGNMLFQMDHFISEWLYK